MGAVSEGAGGDGALRIADVFAGAAVAVFLAGIPVDYHARGVASKSSLTATIRSLLLSVPQPFQRIHRTPLRANFEMHVRREVRIGCPYRAEGRALVDLLPFAHIDPGE